MSQIINEIIIQFICSVIAMITIYYFAKIITGEKEKIGNKKIFIIILLLSIIHGITYFNLNDMERTITMFITNTIFYIYVFKNSILKSILLMFMYTIVLTISELINLFFLTEILGLSKEFCYEIYADSILSNVLVYLTVLVITYISRKLFQKITENSIANNLKIVTLSILTLISILLFFYTIIKEFRFDNNIVIYLVSIIVMVIVLFSLIKQTLRNNKLISEYDKLLEFMATYENEIENQRILRHEIKNEFRTIRAKICDNQENKEIIEYIDEIVNDKYEINKEKYAKFGYLPPNGIKGLCYFKTQEAEDKGVKVSLNISKRVKESTIYNLTLKQQRDFGRILGVFLDNAIEASIESKEKQIGIEAYTNTQKEFKMIITNTYNNKIDKNKIGKESFSTKGKTRGHGLLLVKQLANNNEIFNCKTEVKEDIYIQTIEIKKS